MMKPVLVSCLAALMWATPGLAQDAPGDEAVAFDQLRRSARVVSEGEFRFPEAAVPLRHNGVVTVEGVVGTDGKVEHAAVAASAHSDLLDEAAVDFVRGFDFKPAKGESGQPVRTSISVEVPLSAMTLDPEGYRCDAYVGEIDWWLDANPGRPIEESALYRFFREYAVAPIEAQPGPEFNYDIRREEDRVDTYMIYLERKCRAFPTKRVFDVLERRSNRNSMYRL